MWFVLLLPSLFAAESKILRLYPGYVTRIACEGRLLVSSVGNEAMVRVEALPKELGCGVLMKPSTGAGRTNLILETSAGTIECILSFDNSKIVPAAIDLHYRLKSTSP